MNAILCADLGGSFIKFGIARPGAPVDELERVPMPRDGWQAVATCLDGLARRTGAASSSPIGLSIAGLVDPATGVVTSANLPGLNGLAVAPVFSSFLERPVFAANDADCFTLAEASAGTGQGHSVVFCVIIGTGIGGGLAVHGRPVIGAGGITGEWGHGPILNTSVTLQQRTISLPRLACGCGQSGCVDTLGGARGIERLHDLIHQQQRTSHQIIGDWQSGGIEAAETVEAYVQLVSDPLALAVNITGASVVPVGGGLASAHSLVEALDKAVRSKTLNRTADPLVLPALYRENGGLVGAAVLAGQGDLNVRPA